MLSTSSVCEDTDQGERVRLANRPENYYWSSANYYECGIDDFGFLTHYTEVC